jgi:hypothetical protein
MGGTGTDSSTVKQGFSLSQIRKAIIAGFGAGAAVFAASAILNNWYAQLGAAVAAGLIVGGGTWLLPNSP